MLLADCTPPVDGPSVAQGGDRSARAADAFRIVDCLLPAQTRQLGTRLTYLAARRAIKTAAGDCETRGGEYVVSGGSGSRAALDIWLPLAEANDPQAQTYVGEIYERGIAGAPDYASAAAWYQRAADQGYRRAETNLAVLYETGRGVPRDPQRAVRLYRTAAGLSDEDFRALSVAAAPARPAPAPAPATRQPAASGDQEAARLRQELERAQQQLRTSQGEIASLRERQEQGTAQLRRLQDERRALQQQIEQARAGDSAQLGQLRSSLAERDAQLDRHAAEINRLQRDLAAEEAKAAHEIAAMQEALQRQGASSGQEIAQLQQQLGEARRQLQTYQSDLAVLRREEQQKQQQLASLQDERRSLENRIAGLEGSAGRNEAQLVPLRRELAERNAESVARTDEIERMRLQIADIQRQAEERITAMQATLEQSRQAAAAAPAQPAGAGPAAGEDIAAAVRGSFGHYHALVIGNGGYRHFAALPTAANDARDLAGLLEGQYGFRTTVLTDADRYAVLAALNKLRESLTESDNLLIYYAGHCQIEPGTQSGHWLPIDAEPGNPGTWVSSADITDILSTMTVKQAMVIADSCYSGVLSRTSLTQLEGVGSPDRRKILLRSGAQNRVRVVLSSGGLAPVAASGARNSAFAKALIDTLGSNRDVLGGFTLYRRVTPQTTAAAAAAGARETPDYAPIRHAGHEAGDFYFIPAGSGGGQS